MQGMMFVSLLRAKFGPVPVTEVHPKAVAKAQGGWGCQTLIGLGLPPEHRLEHERDAALAAIAAREGFEGRWTKDLSRERHEQEQDPDSYWLSPVRYFWP